MLRSHLPKALPLGGRCPSAYTGADEGAILYPTFPCRKEGGSRLSPQRKFSSAPLGNPVAPSSVTFGDSFPPRGSLRRWYTPATKCFRTQLPLPQNANPNQGTSMGFVIAHRPEHCAPPRQNERVGTSGPSKRGGGGPPPRLFASGLSLEKAWIPRPGPGGKPPRRCQPAPVPVGAATEDGDPQGAAPRGTVRAATTQRVCSTLSGSRPESGGKPTLQVRTCAGPNGPPTNDRNRAGPPGSPPLMEKGERSTPL